MNASQAVVDPENAVLPVAGPARAEKPTESVWQLIATYVFAAVFVIVYIIFLFSMYAKTAENTSVNWERLVYLFNGVQTIVGAVVGYIFGREVNLGRAINAEKQEVKAGIQREVAEVKKQNAEAAKTRADEDRRDLARTVLAYDLTGIAKAGLVPGNLVDWESVRDKAKRMLA